MGDENFGVIYRFRYPFYGLLILVSMLLLSILISLIGDNQAQATSGGSASQISLSSGDSNIVSDGLDSILNGLSDSTQATVAAVQGANDRFKDASKTALAATVGSAEFIARGAYSAGVITAHGVGSGASFVIHTPVYALNAVSNTPGISSIIRPSESDKTQAPQIDPAIAAELAASKPLPSAVLSASDTDSSPQWPIHGAITEEFGVPHWPYQPVHTGIDISDGAAQGATPIRPFMPGRVIVVIRSNSGFGNHVIVDHGNGLTSLYGHMYATSVQVGQQVDKNTVLGYEGTTGLSTGVHVHFEIDINGQPANPHLYVAGQP